MATWTDTFSSGWASMTLTVTESGTSPSTNSGTITWSLKVKKLVAVSSFNNGGADIRVTINGTRRYTGDTFDIRSLAVNSTKTIASGSFTQKHATNGTLSMTCSASFTSGVGLGNASVSGTFTGTTITGGSVPLATISCDKTKITADTADTAVISIVNGETSALHIATLNVPNYGSFEIGRRTGNGSMSFVVLESVSNFIPYRYTASSITITSTYSNGSKTNQLNIDVYVPVSPPVISGYDITELNEKVSSNFNNCIVKGVSNLRISMNYTTSYMADIQACSTTIGSSIYNGVVFDIPSINFQSGNTPTSTYINDTRDYSDIFDSSFYVYNYNKPTIKSMTTERCLATGVVSSTGTYTKVTISGSVSAIDGTNSKNLYVEWKKTSNVSWSVVNLSIPTNSWDFSVSTVIGPVDTSASYNYKAVLSDKLFTADPSIVSTGTPVISRRAGGRGVTLFAEAVEDGFVVEGATKLKGSLEVTSTTIFNEAVTFEGANTLTGPTTINGGLVLGTNAKNTIDSIIESYLYNTFITKAANANTYEVSSSGDTFIRIGDLQVCWGRANIDATANTTVQQRITFSALFSAAPVIILNPAGTAPNSYSAVPSSSSVDGFTVSLYRTTSTTTAVYWAAIGHKG